LLLSLSLSSLPANVIPTENIHSIQIEKVAFVVFSDPVSETLPLSPDQGLLTTGYVQHQKVYHQLAPLYFPPDKTDG
jgi:hypothetical protein